MPPPPQPPITPAYIPTALAAAASLSKQQLGQGYAYIRKEGAEVVEPARKRRRRGGQSVLGGDDEAAAPEQQPWTVILIDLSTDKLRPTSRVGDTRISVDLDEAIRMHCTNTDAAERRKKPLKRYLAFTRGKQGPQFDDYRGPREVAPCNKCLANDKPCAVFLDDELTQMRLLVPHPIVVDDDVEMTGWVGTSGV